MQMPGAKNEVVLKVYMLNMVCKSWCGHRRKREQGPYKKIFIILTGSREGCQHVPLRAIGLTLGINQKAEEVGARTTIRAMAFTENSAGKVKQGRVKNLELAN